MKKLLDKNILKMAAMGITLGSAAAGFVPGGAMAQDYNSQYYNNQSSDNTGYDDSQNYNNTQYYQDNGDGNQYNGTHYDNNGYVDYNTDYSTFYDELAPYGQWYNDPQYGYVWVPNVEAGFRPYFTNGYWMMTQYGNMWMSNYPWGWAAFHYGRWTYSDFYGWVWIPGNTWGPAWVNWRQGGGYYGWAPLGPGVSISVSLGSGFNVGLNWWSFIPCERLYYRNGYGRYYNQNRADYYYRNTNVINNTYVNNNYRTTYIAGPSVNQVRQYVKNPQVYNVNMRNGFGAGAKVGNPSVSGNTVNMVVPTLKAGSGAGKVAANGQRTKAIAAPKSVQPIKLTNSSVSEFRNNSTVGTAPKQATPTQFNNNYNGVNRGSKTEVNANGVNKANLNTNGNSLNGGSIRQPATNSAPVNTGNTRSTVPNRTQLNTNGNVNRQQLQNNNNTSRPAVTAPQNNQLQQSNRPSFSAPQQQPSQPVRQSVPSPAQSAPVRQATPQPSQTRPSTGNSGMRVNGGNMNKR